MSSSVPARRVPLSANPNAANSPLRNHQHHHHNGVNGTAMALAKQRRSHASMQREENYGQPPPAKKQMLDKLDHGGNSNAVRVASVRSPTTRRVQQQQVQRGTTSRVYQTTTNERSTSHRPHPDVPKVSEKEAEEVRRWQQSQRLRFPKLVFYFDSLPEDQSARLSKHVMYLGAREDKFFSIDITHVVTTRPIPPEEKPLTKQQQQQQQQQTHQGKEDHAPESGLEHLQTINPSLLSRTHAHESNVIHTSLPVKRKLFETAPGRRMPLAPFGAAEDAIRKPKPTRGTDILQRAREMGKKIWSLEKLQRVLDMLLEPDPYRSAELGQRIRNGASTSGTAAGHQQAMSRFSGNQVLLQMLDKERHSGPSDRDPTVATRELIYFKGPYVYVYDIEEKQRPIMVREYAKVADKEEGDWPQLRPSGGPRCPFIENTDQLELRAEKKRAKMRMAAAAATTRETSTTAGNGTAANTGNSGSLQKTLASKYAAAAAAAAAGTTQPKPTTGKRTLTEMEDGHNRQTGGTRTTASVAGGSKLRPVERVCESASAGSAAAAAAAASAAASAGSVSSVASTAPPSNAGFKATGTPSDFQVQNAFTSRARSARCFAGEPVASGLQAAGITSAIRSQMISSATGTLGARAGTSKEIHGLQRKVLQKSASTSQQDLSSRRMTELSMDQLQLQQQQQQQQQTRHAYTRSTSLGRSTAAAQLSAKLGTVQDDATPHDEKHKRTMSAPVSAQPAPRQRKRDPKPGYCENCQDKFDDFDDHIASHKHRKFAEDDRNWTELDELLSQLTRCPKYGFEEWQ
ncbi:g1 s regulator [Niveomyces insectorum RCEF 264]|uniref:G1 s regulator n=1 Tax=Niveomyces insectorum RCEF 264 TaxID=1081102 RepID=A0A167VJ35_9HYPO|nr:g1 s regulator [Niveomyces insectorum RCEF 264]